MACPHLGRTRGGGAFHHHFVDQPELIGSASLGLCGISKAADIALVVRNIAVEVGDRKISAPTRSPRAWCGPVRSRAAWEDPVRL